MIDPLHREFLTIIDVECDDLETEQLASDPQLLSLVELWFIRGYESGLARGYRRYNPAYIEVFGGEDYGDAICILRQPIRC